MILRLDTKPIRVEKADNLVEDERYRVWWDGLIFIKGVPSGEQSVRDFLAKLHSKELTQTCHRLSGTFVCFVFDKLTENYYAFVDNSRKANLFCYEKVLDTSFLDVLKHVQPTLGKLRMQTIVEFILTGFVFCPNVYFDNLRLLQRDEILIINSGKQQVIKKYLPDLFSEGSHRRFMEVFEEIVKSVKNRRLTLHLTGGIDSRLTVLLFREFDATFETAVCGIANHPDITISSQLATNLGLNHHVTLHTVDESSLWQELEETFQLCDGLGSVLSNHRSYQMLRDMINRGRDLEIGASGGELYKDEGLWLTALLTKPGFNRPETTLKKLVGSGAVCWGLDKAALEGLFSLQTETIANEYKQELLSSLRERFWIQNKYKLADLIFYEYSVNAPRDGRHNVLDSYIPLLERELVSIGVNLPLHKRLFYRFHRELMTPLSAEAAKFKTTRDGRACATGLQSLLKDSLIFLRHSIQSRMGQTMSVSKDNPALYSRVRASKRAKELFDILKQYRIILDRVVPESVDDKYLDRLVTVSMLLEEMDRSKSPSPLNYT